MSISHEVKQGDCIYSIAYRYGFFADTIWNHPNNKELKEKREDPHVLMPGDVVFVPDKQLKEVSEATNQVHKFRCKNTPKSLRIQLKYFDTPLGNIDYEISVDGLEKTGTTSSDGWIVCSIPPNAKLAKISLTGGLTYEVKLGYLNPLDEITGIQGRLAHLGFYEGSINGRFDQETKEAVNRFQISRGLEPTGRVDDQTRNLLKELTAI